MSQNLSTQGTVVSSRKLVSGIVGALAIFLGPIATAGAQEYIPGVTPPANGVAVSPGGPEEAISAVNSWLFGIDTGLDDGSSSLFRIDPSDASVSPIGETNREQIGDIAFLIDGRLVGAQFFLNDTLLVELDPLTGTPTTPIGRGIGYIQVNALVSESKDTFFGATPAGEFMRIDANTGVGTLIGSFGSGLGSSGDLAVDSDGTVYGVAFTGGVCCNPAILVEIDPSTGAATDIGAIGYDDIFGLAFGADGVLYAVADGGTADIPLLISINKATGAGSTIGQMPIFYGFGGLAKELLLFDDGFES